MLEEIRLKSEQAERDSWVFYSEINHGEIQNHNQGDRNARISEEEKGSLVI